MNVIAKDVVEHYRRGFAMLDELVDLIGDDRWKDDADPVAIPARWATHAAVSAEFYTQYVGHEFDWSLVPDWEGPLDALPERGPFKAYSKEVLAGLCERWENKSDEEMMSQTGYDWTGFSRLAQLLYGLRHFTYHLGELSMIVRQSGSKESPWH